MTLANYQFFPWLREGLGNTIAEKDTFGKGVPPVPGVATSGRALLKLQLNINNLLGGTKDFWIVGPADITGFSKDLVIRTEPVHWSTTFASNLLAHVEFYEEDFPWRYSPAQADGDKLRPWLSLIVLKETEFERSETVVPLPQIKLLADPSVLPAYDETWLWAHVQKIDSSTLASDQNMADHIISRLICPRKLEANTRYYAFVVPTFETGRLAGLGKTEEDINKVLAQDPAWGLNASQTVFPVYYEWFFRTADEMDFEYLASLLEPKAIDPLVGRKAIDCSKPGFGIPDYANEFTLYVEGALSAPQSPGSATINSESANNLVDFEARIKQLIDLATTTTTGDPVVTPPFYGQKHIFEQSLLLTGKSWIHQLNKNPAHRAASGLGAQVFRKYQDLYLQKAWEQLETIVEANKIIDAANATLAVCQLLYEKSVMKLPAEELVTLTGPVHVKARVKDSDGNLITLFEAFRQSCFNGSAYSTAFRTLTSRRGAFRRKLERNGVELDLGSLQKLMTTNKRRPFILENPRRYNILVTDRPVFNYVFSTNFGDRVLINNEAEFKDAFSAFTKKVENPLAPKKCEDSIQHNILEIINPSRSITRLLSKRLDMPVSDWFKDPLKIKAALAYPDFEDPMVEKLKQLSPDWLAPNLHLIPNNSITLLKPNRKFIEAFMLGINVAMNQEMRWREYPTDERASCFRQFWDVKGIKNINGSPDAASVVEEYKDISPIDTWKNWDNENNKKHLDEFGGHNTRSSLPEEEQLVLVIKGDLLKCFPNTTIYAVKADENTFTNEGKLVIKSNAEIIFPAFKAEAGVDLKFIGFDLTITVAKGNALKPAGWFFILQETPGEARFGLDTISPTIPGQKFTWDHASWDLVAGNKISINETASKTKVAVFENNLDATEKKADGSLKRKWGRTSADMAYILYQKPVMIAIHANEMLT